MRCGCWLQVEKEGTRKKHPCDTITEGIGINRQVSHKARTHTNKHAKRADDQQPLQLSVAPCACSQWHCRLRLGYAMVPSSALASLTK